jgi:hypothetical protein
VGSDTETRLLITVAALPILAIEAQRIAANIAKLPELLRKIMTYCRRGVDMRKRVGFLLSLLAGLLSACATPRWVKPEASKTDLAQDQAACVHEVQQPPPAGTTDQQHYEACPIASVLEITAVSDRAAAQQG